MYWLASQPARPRAAVRERLQLAELGRSPAISECPLPASIPSSRHCPEPTTSHGAAMSRARCGERVSGGLAVRIAAPYRSPSPMRMNHACRRSLNGEQRAIGRSLPRTSSQLLSEWMNSTRRQMSSSGSGTRFTLRRTCCTPRGIHRSSRGTDCTPSETRCSPCETRCSPSGTDCIRSGTNSYLTPTGLTPSGTHSN